MSKQQSVGSAHNNVELSELVENLYEMVTVLSSRVYILEKEKDGLLKEGAFLEPEGGR